MYPHQYPNTHTTDDVAAIMAAGKEAGERDAKKTLAEQENLQKLLADGQISEAEHDRQWPSAHASYRAGVAVQHAGLGKRDPATIAAFQAAYIERFEEIVSQR